MKKILPVVILLFITVVGSAQNNVVKLGVLNIAYGDYNIAYERVINEKSSINLTVGFWKPSLDLAPINEAIKSNEGIWIQELRSGKNIALDYRFYTGDVAPKGFYLGPYLRYWDLELLLGDVVKPNNFDVTTNLKSIGAGVQFGYQWIIAKTVSIDWYFLGLGAEWFMPEAKYVINPLQDNFDYASIEENVMGVFKNASYFEDKAKSVINNDNMEISMPVLLPGIRTGLTIGFAF